MTRGRDRRLWLGRAACGALAAFLAACAGSKFTGPGKAAKATPPGGRDRDSDDDDDDDDDGKGPERAPKAGVDHAECQANAIKEIALAEDDGTPALAPACRFYGTARSTMLVLKFPSEGLGQAATITVATTAGRLLAVHSVTAADFGTAPRPIVIDHLRVGSEAKLAILVQDGDDRRVYRVPVTYFTEFEGKKVTDLSVGAFPNFQAVARFVEDGASFGIDATTLYPDATGASFDRPLVTAKPGSRWTVSADAFKGGAVTDLMGERLALDGSTILENQVFCVYVDDGGATYRTMIHLG